MTNCNVTISPDGKTATLVIDLTKRFGPSASGKTIQVASTHGNKVLGSTGVTLGLNAYCKP